MPEKLKPCPHCGGVAVTEHATFRNPDQNRCAIVCEGCGAYGGPALGSDRDIVAAMATELWNTRPDIRRKTIEECAKLCEGQVQRPAGYNGAWEGYGPSMGDKTGTECAIAIRALAEAKP